MFPTADDVVTSSLEPSNATGASSSQAVLFTPYERTGVIIMAVAGVSSCVLVSTLLLSIILTALSPWPRKSQDTSTPFTNKQFAVFVTCLLLSDLIQSVSGITQVKWAAENQIYEGTACSIQAAALVMGDLGSTVWSCVIAAHTFYGLALGKQWSRTVVCVTVVTGWTCVTVLTFVGPLTLPSHESGPFFSIAGTWCFISSEHAVARLVIHYVPLFVAAAIIFVFYSLVFLVLRGSINFNSHHPYTTASLGNDTFARQRVTIAKRMLWYPVGEYKLHTKACPPVYSYYAAYLTCILPIAVTRLIGFDEETVPEAVWIFGMFFLFFLGAADAVVYATTRNMIKPLALPFYMSLLSRGRPVTMILPPDPPRSPRDSDTDDTGSGSTVSLEKLDSSRKITNGIHITREQIQEDI
ncbi:hypothetical protein K439DRAFT_1616137 [Ramaria rubella]|nr:hypothetical protein K439DRAFT_1616137 [Ramaria rubella]